MSSPQLAKAESERPPGPHRPDVQLISADAADSPKEAVEKQQNGDEKDSNAPPRDARRQRFVLTDPIAFRYCSFAVLSYTL